MDSHVFHFIQNLTSTFHIAGIPCVFKETPQDLKKETGSKPLLILLRSGGIYSKGNCVFQTLNFQLLYPVSSVDLESFLSFQEKIDDALHEFLKDHEDLGLKYSPNFTVLVDKNLYQALFILDLNPLDIHLEHHSMQQHQEAESSWIF